MYQSKLQQSINALQNLSSDELRELLGDDEKLDEQVNEVITAIDSSKDFIINENRRLAEANLAFEPKMIELRSRVQELTNEGQQLGDDVKAKLDQLKSKGKTSNADMVLALLQTAAAESEEESENLVKQFTDGELTADAFVEQFMNIRKLMHIRKLKAERMVELVHDEAMKSVLLPGAGLLSLGPYAPPVAPTGFFSPPYDSGAAMPYPTGAGSVSMPMFPRY